jgi:hypothetical protein
MAAGTWPTPDASAFGAVPTSAAALKTLTSAARRIVMNVERG